MTVMRLRTLIFVLTGLVGVVLFVGSFGPGAAHAHGHRASDGSAPAAQARQHGGSGSVAFTRPAGIATTFAATSVLCWVVSRRRTGTHRAEHTDPEAPR